ncbi:transcriptional repressor LexA [Rubellicoccus peritrichatus]|uniref:Transcriptional repressor LexA n=1 Tax=Rubellicoccus peritrichatus TaxID=3080537 RepID=A0AAQ3QQH6_9BACT|nr:transcriptional repressor LexA [Puniceicoccus sp. CR14]WOO40253.1 transcriptional repressor LexA [Puniceicoccus sp. CR14]
MKGLTTRQHEILGFVQLHFRQQSYWPSIREIQSHFGFKSTNAVMGHLRALERKGYISRVSGQARAFRVTYDPNDEKPEDATEVIDIPVYGSIAAGYPDGVETGGEIGRLQIDVGTAGVRRSRRAFALKVRGESMIDAGIFDGDIVIVEPGLPKSEDIVAALIDNETTLKRFIQEGSRPPFLKAENVAYPTLHPVSELVIQGIVKAVVRSL